MSSKKRGPSSVWILIGLVLFVISCICLIGLVASLGILSGTSKSESDYPPTPTPLPTPTSVYHEGVSVILNNLESLNDRVELWLVYDDCDIDVVYNYVPNGTTATLTGKMCYGSAISYGKANFYEVHFSSDVEGLQGDNFWVDEKYMSIRK